MLALPVDVICGGILPYLAVCDLQALDTAFTNKYLRPQLRQVWKSYQCFCPDQEELSESQVAWLFDVCVPVSGVVVGTIVSDSSITSISTLKRLTVRFRVLSSTLLKLASNSPNLEELYVNNVCGPVTDDAVSALAQNCRQLHKLHINSKELTDTGIIALAKNCHQLHTFHIHGALDAEVTDAGIQALCANCPHLKHIGLSYCRNLTDASLIAIANSYPHLQSIGLFFCHFTDDGLIYFADKCHELQSVSVRCDNITIRGLTALWAANPNITEVDISENTFITDDDIVKLVQCCPLLQKLNMCCCSNITDAAVIAVAEHCPQLSSLNISCCFDLSDASLIALGQHCHELKSINVSFLKKVSDVGIAALAAGCPLLQEFYARDTHITDAGVVALARGCRDLRIICLGECKSIGFAAVSAIAENCALLSELFMFCSLIDDASMHVIAQHCRNLSSLDVSYSRVFESASIKLVIRSFRFLRKFRCNSCLMIDENTKNELRKLATRLNVFDL